ncbi:hypothetical protein HMPREF2785_05415 [Corynebacterium sp. HMSC067D03]|uniref:FitA-like ribbon-helix-helix domain-containing protein n=1 Tax=unclassified Corynebacterium TaxID=2624378 RepID=UPI0008A54F9D|nr:MULTISPECIES: Arc family DNA-binding protein [unclassified Corynebacterium]OFL13484.1 hypothetical protein HMPREF2785_05415 [Corynebacterium sp. HMSC067D03]OHO31640.1 hypothetical protein HMPREF2690_11465 [Corynebacterium sp. HMSC034E11]
MTAPSKERKAATITVRGLNTHTKQRIQQRAKHHGRSMESEVRAILEAAAETTQDPLHGLRLPAETLARLEAQAKGNARSLEDEARAVLERGTRPVDAGRLLYALSREHGGFDEIVIPERSASREIPDFS